MILIFRILLIIVRSQCQIFQPRFRDSSRPAITQHLNSSPRIIQSHCQRSVQCQLVSIHLTDRSVPNQVHLSCFPAQSRNTSAKNMATDRGNPFLCGRAENPDPFSGSQLYLIGYLKSTRIYRNVWGQHIQCIRNRQIIPSFHIKQSSPVHSLFQQHSLLLVTATQHHSRHGDTQTLLQIKGSFIQQDCSTEPVFIRSQ